nr:hypothetical protein [uncultured Pseudomonas sp.]
MQKETTRSLPACRLSVRFAREAPVAVLLRRGPSRWVQLITWHLNNDRMESGQWIKARIYEDLCDLSEDGELFIYSARKGSYWTTSHRDKVGETWTTISRPPFFSALALWPNGCWDGGGMFTARRSVTLGLPTPRPHPDLPPTGIDVQGYPMPKYQPQNLSTLIALRDGWQPLMCSAEELQGYDWRFQSPLEKLGRKGSVRIVRTSTHGKHYRTTDHFRVLNVHGETDLGATDFVDFDSKGRLVQGRSGRLLVCSDPTEQQLEWQELADFSSSVPTPLPPAGWAKDWPK